MNFKLFIDLHIRRSIALYSEDLVQVFYVPGVIDIKVLVLAVRRRYLLLVHVFEMVLSHAVSRDFEHFLNVHKLELAVVEALACFWHRGC